MRVNTDADLRWSEPSGLISWVQRGTQPGLKQKSQAIYQAADADSLNSLAQKLLQTRPLLWEKRQHNWIYDWNFGTLLSFLILLRLLCCTLRKRTPRRYCYIRGQSSNIYIPALFIFILKIFGGLVSLASIKETK